MILGINHPILRACLRLVKIQKGIEVASIADVPAGTGIGSSSAFTVSLMHAFNPQSGKINKKIARNPYSLWIF